MKPVTKKWIFFLSIVTVSLLIGFGIGWGIVTLQDGENWNPAALLEMHALALAVVMQCIFTLITVGALAVVVLQVNQVKNRFPNLEMDDEEALDRAEEKLNFPMIVSSLLLIWGFLMFPVPIWFGMQETVVKAMRLTIVAIDVVTFFVAMFGSLITSRGMVNLLKQINPEKKGDMLDLTFHKEWVNSCDEAQKAAIYKAGYKAYQVGSNVCMCLWLVSVILMMTFNMSPLTSVMVCIVWLSLNIAYFVGAAKG